MNKKYFLNSIYKKILRIRLEQDRLRIMPINAYMIRLFLCFFLMSFCSKSVISQKPFKIFVQIQPPYSPYLNDYLNLQNKTIINVTNTSNKSYNFFLKFSLTNNTNFSAYTKEDFKPGIPLTINAGQTINIIANETAKSSFSDENIEVNYGDYSIGDILRDGVLPDGKYTLCIKAFDYDGLNQISDEIFGCTSFNISYLNAPKITDCNDKVFWYSQPQNLVFNWLPVSGNTQNKQILYDLYLAKIEEQDNPQDIIESSIATNSGNLIKVSGIFGNSYIYNQNNPHLELGRYAWAVKARSYDGSIPIHNDGLSNVCTVDYSIMQMKANKVNINGGIDCSCKTTLPDNLSPITDNSISSGTVFKSGKLNVTINSITKTRLGYTGLGTVNLPVINSGLVKVNVSFENIDIQKSGNDYYHTGGLITSVLDQKASFLPSFNPIDPGSMNLNPAQVQSLSSFFESYTNQLISKIKSYPNTIAYNLPIGLDEKAMTIAITNLVLKPTQSYFDAVSILDIVDGNTKVALAGQGICVDDRSFCGEAKLSLIENFNIPSIGISLNGNKDNSGTSLTFDKEGFKQLHISATYTFPQGSLVDVKTNQPAKVSIVSDTDTGWSDWLAEIQIDEFYMFGFQDMTFGPDNKNTKILYDHSDKRNPVDIPSPYTSSDQSDQPIATNLLTWHGFYIPSIDIKLPASLTNVNGSKLTIKAEKLIFDGGLSGIVSVNNVMSISDGSIDGWYYSIDQFKINIWKNTFKSSSMNGKIVLPISVEYKEVANQLNYTCTLSKPANSNIEYSFKIMPKDNIAFNVLWAKCNLSEGTSIQIVKVDNKNFVAKAVLHGSLTVQANIADFPKIDLAGVKFQGLTFQSQAPYFKPGEVNACLFSAASPQHSLMGFSIGFDPTYGQGVSLYLNGNGAGAQLGLKFKAQLKLVKDVDFVPKADVEFNIFGKLNFDGIRPKWEGIGANISSIKLEAGAKIGPVGVVGELGYFNDHNGTYGFMGKLNMDVASVISLDAKAQFGYSDNEGGFNYFFIDGMVDLKKVGIPMGPGLFMYGFGGGVFYNMTIQNDKMMDGSQINGSPKYVFDKNNPEPGVSLSGIKYTPKKGLFSVKASVLFGLGTRDVFDADGSVVMEFNAQTGGVKSILFQATGRFITKSDDPLAERNNKCMGHLDIEMEMNFDEKSFIFHADVKAGVPTYNDLSLFYLSANLNFYGGPSGWFVHVGRPWKDGNFNGGGPPVEIKVINTLLFKGYFQCGDGSGKIWDKGSIISGVSAVDPMPPIPNFILNIINNNNRKGENGEIANSVTDFNNLGSQDLEGGLAFGANFKTQLDVSFLIFYLNAEFMVGFDLAFYHLSADAKCINEEGQLIEKGVNGFYASGQAYLGAKLDVGVDIDLFFFSGKISIISAGAAAYVKFGAPSPSYASGALGGYFSILGGLIEGAFAVKFFIGEKCFLPTDESIDLISAVSPSGDFDKLDYSRPVSISELQPVDLQPFVNFNFEINKTFLIFANVPDNPDEPSSTYRQYRYYHILPSDIKINLYGGQIFKNGDLLTRPLNFNDFKVSGDNYTVQLKEPIMLHNEQSFTLDVSVKVKLMNLEERSKNQASTKQGYKDDSELNGVSDFNRNGWGYALNVKKEVFIDQRHVNFKTDCGIKSINMSWITDNQPLHRSQNNPYGYSPPFNQKQLREGSHFEPLYNVSKVKDSMAKAGIKPIISVSTTNSVGKNELLMSLNNGYLSEDFICIPPEFKNNFDFKFKVSSFGKSNSGNSFTTKIIDAQISSDKRTISAKLDSDFPNKSFVVVQLMIKIKKSANANQSNDLSSNFIVSKTYVDNAINLNTRILARSVNLESKLSLKNNEIELFRWYFTTGSYGTYRDKMADLVITTDTATVTSKLYNFNKGGYQQGDFKVLKSSYNFLGNEEFDFHDLKEYSLQKVFESNTYNKTFSKKLADGYLGFAFDKVSQDVVDDFLRTYFEDSGVKKVWESFASNPKGITGSDYSIKERLVNIMNSYITDKMFDATQWSDVTKWGEILEPLEALPTDLYFNSDFVSHFRISMPNSKPKVLFTLEKLSRVIKFEKSTTKIIPSHIINMKNLIDNMPSNGSIVLQSYLADVMQNFNNTIFPKISQGFSPALFNNMSNFKK